MGGGNRCLSLRFLELRRARHVGCCMVGARQPLSVLQTVPVYAAGVVGNAAVRRRSALARG